MDEVKIYELKNGLRIVHRYVPTTRLVHCAMLVDAGSRDERPHEQGIAHCIEHMAFKGTTRRKAYHILNHIDGIGGELNAYTAKDKTTFHATVTADHTARAFDLLADITFHSTFPAHELEKEKVVISEEIDMYRDDPEEAIFEDFDEIVFGKHALAHPIVGRKEVVQQFSAGLLKQFVVTRYLPRQVVFGVVGNATEKQVRSLADKYLIDIEWAKGDAAPKRTPPTDGKLKHVRIERPIQQAHLILGGRAPALGDADYYAFMLLQNFLGGPTMNNRLTMNIRERYGLAYNLQAFTTPYKDAGAWGVYAACDRASLARVRTLIEKELYAMAAAPLSAATFSRISKQYQGQAVIAFESLSGQIHGYARDLLDFDQAIPLTEVLEKIAAVTPAQMQRAARKYCQPEQLHSITYVPQA